MLEPPPVKTVAPEEPHLLEDIDAIYNIASKGTDVLEIVAVPKVIDFDTYEPRFCTCTLVQLWAPKFCVVLAFPTVWQCWPQDLPFVEFPMPPDAAEYAAQDAWQRYHHAYYTRARFARDQTRSRV